MAAEKASTKLRVIITEDAFRNLEVEWDSIFAETGESVYMRPSHVIGQLITAALIVAAKSYEGFRGEIKKAVEAGEVTSKEPAEQDKKWRKKGK
jgi:hypothetical protein